MIMDELKWDPKLSSAYISVAVTNGVVILSGIADSYAQKLAAEDAVRRVKDVKGLVEEVTVQLPPDEIRADPDLEMAVANALKWSHSVHGHPIRAVVEAGWLTLEGTVDWQFQKDAAGNAVKDITGLRGVSNLVHMKPYINVPVVRETVRKAFERNANVDSGRIIVETSGNKITLSGKARSWSEREEVERVAWCAPGVLVVEDNLIIAP